MNSIETQKRDLELELAVCKAEISQLHTEIEELNASLNSAHSINLKRMGNKVDSPNGSPSTVKLSRRRQILYRLHRVGFWLKNTKVKSIYLRLPSSLQSLVQSIARRIGLI
jgi:hypothetical protein